MALLEPEDMEYRVEEPDFDMGNGNENFEEDPIGTESTPPRLTTVESARIDMESLPREYTDYALMHRLLFIADVCPPLRYEALRTLINYAQKNTQNVQIYSLAYQKVEATKQSGQTAGAEIIPPMDAQWVEQTAAKSQTRLETYLAEFKRQKDEGVKESIRRSMDDVFHQYLHMGNVQEALKLYGRGMREYCTAPNFVIQMLLNWINVTIYADQWPKLGILIPQAERAIQEAIDRENAATASGSATRISGGLPGTPGKHATGQSYKELIASSKAKVAAVTGLARMQERQYKQAAESFMTVDLDALEYPQLLSAGDVAVYGTLCALATFRRGEIKERVLGSTLFRKFLESEPKLVEILQKFFHSEFSVCLTILDELKDQLLLNMFLAPHLHHLYLLIRHSSISQYFDPFLSADIRTMAREFRTSPEDMEEELIRLISEGTLRARIDSYQKTVHAKFVDNRAETYKRILTLQQRLGERANAILLRAALQQNKIQVAGPEGGTSGGGRATAGRRRPAPYHMDDFSDDAHPDITAFDRSDGSQNGGAGGSGGGIGNRLMQGAKSLLNAATSRIHPSSTSSAGSSASVKIADSSTASAYADVPPPPGGSGDSAVSSTARNGSGTEDADMADI